MRQSNQRPHMHFHHHNKQISAECGPAGSVQALCSLTITTCPRRLAQCFTPSRGDWRLDLIAPVNMESESCTTACSLLLSSDLLSTAVLSYEHNANEGMLCFHDSKCTKYTNTCTAGADASGPASCMRMHRSASSMIGKLPSKPPTRHKSDARQNSV
jgi:hypothetical protein